MLLKLFEAFGSLLLTFAHYQVQTKKAHTKKGPKIGPVCWWFLVVTCIAVAYLIPVQYLRLFRLVCYLLTLWLIVFFGIPVARESIAIFAKMRFVSPLFTRL